MFMFSLQHTNNVFIALKLCCDGPVSKGTDANMTTFGACLHDLHCRTCDAYAMRCSPRKDLWSHEQAAQEQTLEAAVAVLHLFERARISFTQVVDDLEFQ